jgi:uncharacterized membrane protein
VDTLLARLDDVDHRLRRLDREVQELRTLAREATAEPLVEAPRSSPAAPAAPSESPLPSAPSPPAASAVRAPLPQPAPPRETGRAGAPPPRHLGFRIEPADLFGARALAWSGGVVTLLGVVFFFALAGNRGWIGPEARIAFGGVASLLLFVGGVVARSRFGQLHSAVAAAGAGLAGAYATLLAAAALYDFVPAPIALLIACGIAAAGVRLALAWSSEALAALALLGATLAPLALVPDEDAVSVLGTAFVAVVFAAAALVASRRRWRALLAGAVLAGVPQIAALVAQQGEGAPGRVVVLAVVWWLALVTAGLVWQHDSPAGTLERATVSLLMGSAGFALLSAPALLNGSIGELDRTGAALLLAALVYGAAAAATFRPARELSVLLAALALVLGAVAAASLFGGASLALVWAAEAIVLAWLAGRLAEARFGAAALAYLGLAAAHVLAVEARPAVDLFDRVADPAAGAWVAALVGVAGLAVGRLAAAWPTRVPRRGRPGELLDAFVGLTPFWRVVSGWGGAALILFGASLGVLAAALEAFAPGDAYAWGHVGVTSLWALVVLALLAVTAVSGRRPPLLAAAVLLAATIYKVFAFDIGELGLPTSGVSALVVAAAALAAAMAYELFRERADASLLASALLAARGVDDVAVAYFAGTDARGFGLALVAAVYALVAVGMQAVAGRRDMGTALGAVALVFGLAASVELLHGTALVVAWATAAAALGWVAYRTGERRLQLGAIGLSALALVTTLVLLAPPADLFVAGSSPAAGVPALVAALLALTALIALGRPSQEPRDSLDAGIDVIIDRERPRVVWLTAALTLYGLSLTTVELVERVGGGDVTTAFQRGHTAVSALWAAVGLALVYVGLVRGRSAIRLAGMGLLAVTLAKIFLYDLAALSSVTRALSFLAVGAVLLLAGFFTQRLTARAEGEARTAS